jgi:hypothetical protein
MWSQIVHGCEHASNIDQLFGEHATTNQMVATPIGVQSGRRFTVKFLHRMFDLQPIRTESELSPRTGMTERGSETLLIDHRYADTAVGGADRGRSSEGRSDRVGIGSAASHPPTPPAALGEKRCDAAKNPITHLRWSVRRYSEKPG